MDLSFPGVGTLLNASTVALGAGVGMAVGHRLPQRTRDVVTDCLGLVTLLMAALSASSVTDAALRAAVGSSAPVLIVLASLLVGGIAGSLLQIERRLGELAGHLQSRFASRRPAAAARDTDDRRLERERFIQGWLTATLLFCVGPLTILGAINDGLGRGIDQLAVKSVLDGFAAIAFAASFGVGVLLSAGSVLIIQGALTGAGLLLGAFMPEAQIAALTATGGLLLVGIALRLLRLRDVPVADLLPALVVAPVLTTLVAALA